MTARVGWLVDDRGKAWEEGSPELFRRLGRRDADFDLASYAVRNLGFIHLRLRPGSVYASVRAGFFTHETLIAALYRIVDCAPPRILLRVFSDDAWSYKIFPNIGQFTAFAERLASGDPIVPGRLFSFKQHENVLRSRHFSAVRPMLAHWHASRGQLAGGFSEIFRDKFSQQRSVLVRRASRSTPFVFEYFGPGITTIRPCEALALIGREMADAPDSEYSQWVAESFAEAAAGERPRVETVRARIHTSGGGMISASYHRVLLPWRRGSDTVVLGMSILRERSPVA